MFMLAFDLGASSGRAFLGRINQDRLEIEEIYRFPNEPVQLNRRLHWNILQLFQEMRKAILKSKQKGYDIDGIGIDTWGVDFGLLNHHGELLANPYHYRDRQNEGMIDKLPDVMSHEQIFNRTGIQFITINTLNQLYAMKLVNNPLLAHADLLLMIPCLLRFFLTGKKANEYTIASTSQLLNQKTKKWDWEIIDSFGFPKHLFREIVQPGTQVGYITKEISNDLGVKQVPVFAVAEHDTASAVVSIPAQSKDFAYLISGTWSLLGTELKEPIISNEALRWNFSNEGGVNGKIRFLKNIVGLWILQECKRFWDKGGREYTYEELVKAAEHAKHFQSFIDVDDPMFIHPGHMPMRIQQYCKQTGQKVPQTRAEIVRCVMESMALKYRFVLEKMEKITDKQFEGLHIVGGGVHNNLLCQWISNAIERPVWAGPAEASAIGNIIMQLIGMGQINTINEARKMIYDSFPIVIYEPQNTYEWKQAFEKFMRIISK